MVSKLRFFHFPFILSSDCWSFYLSSAWPYCLSLILYVCLSLSWLPVFILLFCLSWSFLLVFYPSSSCRNLTAYLPIPALPFVILTACLYTPLLPDVILTSCRFINFCRLSFYRNFIYWTYWQFSSGYRHLPFLNLLVLWYFCLILSCAMHCHGLPSSLWLKPTVHILQPPHHPGVFILPVISGEEIICMHVTE
jgi:hypothetical protein